MRVDPNRTLYRPIVDSNDRLLEDERTYVERVALLLPNFPADVLGQWFFDHWMQITDNAWLDLPSLRFANIAWETGEVPLQNFGHEELLRNRVRYFESEQSLPDRFCRLLRYMTTEGSWPRPIIVLDTETHLAERPAWLSEGRYHLLGGHNRVAAFRYLRERVPLQPLHRIWLVSREPAI